MNKIKHDFSGEREGEGGEKEGGRAQKREDCLPRPDSRFISVFFSVLNTDMVLKQCLEFNPTFPKPTGLLSWPEGNAFKSLQSEPGIERSLIFSCLRD